MRCVLVNSITNIVENIIIADPSIDPAPTGFVIIQIPDDSPVTFGWVYNPNSGTFADPNA